MNTPEKTNYTLEIIKIVVSFVTPTVTFFIAYFLFKRESKRWYKQKQAEGHFAIRNYILEKEIESWEALYCIISYYAPNNSEKTIITGKKGNYIFRKKQAQNAVNAINVFFNDKGFAMYIENDITKKLSDVRAYTNSCVGWCKDRDSISLKDNHANNFFRFTDEARQIIKSEKNKLRN
ncbi:MAG: hypothetical protein ACEPOW_06800 [Bacteroidales bacterium]